MSGDSGSGLLALNYSVVGGVGFGRVKNQITPRNSLNSPAFIGWIGRIWVRREEAFDGRSGLSNVDPGARGQIFQGGEVGIPILIHGGQKRDPDDAGGGGLEPNG